MSEFGGAVEAKGQAYRANAAVDVELHVVKLKHAFDVLLTHGRQNQWAKDGEADLAAVRVAREHQVDERKAGVEDDILDVVRLMAHEDHGCAGVRGDRKVEIGNTHPCIVGTAQPDNIAAALERKVAVDEHGSAMGLERWNDVVGADVDVMVAEDTEALGRFEGGEDLGGYAGGAPGDGESEWAAADKIAGDQHEIGRHGVDLGDHLLEEPSFGELLQVDITHLNDPEVLKAVGEIANGDGEARDFELVARVGSRVDGDAEASSGECGTKEAAASEVM